MSMVADPDYLHVPSDQSCGSSDAAKVLESMFSEISSKLRNSVSLGLWKEHAEEELAAVFDEACEPGWDGYGAAAASFESYIRARRFIQALPANLPLPDIAVEPDGQIAFEWQVAPKRALSISVGDNDELVYAGMKGANKFHGNENFTWSIPRLITDLLRRVVA